MRLWSNYFDLLFSYTSSRQHTVTVVECRDQLLRDFLTDATTNLAQVADVVEKHAAAILAICLHSLSISYVHH